MPTTELNGMRTTKPADNNNDKPGAMPNTGRHRACLL